MKPFANCDMVLFDEYPVTQSDIELWLDTVPNLSLSKFRRESYAKAYRVADKIRAAKKRGEWPPTRKECEI